MNCNSPYFILRRKIVFEHLEKFKDTPSRTIARILLRDYPEYFASEDSARTMVRLYRGRHGKYNRESIKNHQYFQDVQPT